MRFYIPISPTKGIGKIHIESRIGEVMAAAAFLNFLKPLLKRVDCALRECDWDGFAEEGLDLVSAEGICLEVMIGPEGLCGVHLEGPPGTEKATQGFFNTVKPFLDRWNKILEDYGWTYEREKQTEEISDEKWKRLLEMERQGEIKLVPENDLDERNDSPETGADEKAG